MPAINSSTLFHLTKKNADLKRIVQKGLRFSYCLETYKEKIKKENNVGEESSEYGVAIPMVCFCDIPLLRINDHRHKFGSYAIGFDKDIISKFYNHILNPVWYIDSNNVSDTIPHFSEMVRESDSSVLEFISEYSKNPTLNAQYEKDGQDAITKNDELMGKFLQNINDKYFGNTLLGFSKPYGCNESNNKYTCYHDEKEWRAIKHDKEDENAIWMWDVNKDVFYSNREKWNKKIESGKDGFITILKGWQYQAITHIIVKTENQIQFMINLIMNSRLLFGISKISYEERLHLVSKITSFERIEKDY